MAPTARKGADEEELIHRTTDDPDPAGGRQGATCVQLLFIRSATRAVALNRIRSPVAGYHCLKPVQNFPDLPTHDLAVSAVRGVFWTGGSQVVRQITQLITSVVLVRLLLPGDFGLVAMVGFFIGFTGLFVDFGMGAAIIQSRRLGEEALAGSFWISIGVASAFAGLLMVFAPAISTFYGDPRIASLVPPMSAALLISAMMVVPKALLHKAMDFRNLARAEVLGSWTGSVTAVAMAMGGLGVWSLVAHPIAGNCVTLALIWRRSAWWPRLRFSWRTIDRLIQFSASVFGTSLLNYANRNVDNLLIGKFLGNGPLGYYSVAYQIMLFPLTQVSSVIVRVLFPVLSQLQDDHERFRAAYLKAVSAIAILTFPMTLGLLAVAQDFIVVVFGEKWLPMLWVVKVFCLVGLLQSVVTTVGTIYLGTGRTMRLFVISLVFTPIFISAFVIGLRWGIEGVAFAYACVNLILGYVSLSLAFRLVSLKFADFHRAILPPLIVSTVMALIVMGFNHAANAFLPVNARLAVSVLLGISLYVALSLAANRTQVHQLLNAVRSSLMR